MMTTTMQHRFNEFVEDVWPGISLKRYVAFTAGLLTAEGFIFYPLDLVTVRLQISPLPQKFMSSFVATWKSQISSYGVGRGLYHGVSFTLAASIPYHLIYFASYNASLKQLEKKHEETWGLQLMPKFVLPGLAGAVAECASVFVSVPQDVVTQKLQTEGVVEGVNARQMMRRIWNDTTHGNSGGFRNFFKGTGATLATYLPGGMIWWITFEQMKKQLNRAQNIVEDESSDLSYGNLTIASATAGIFASAFSNPFDICKTRIQTGLQCYGKRYTLAVMAQLVVHEGIRSLIKGLIGRIAIAVPTSITGGLSYEVIIYYSKV